MKIVLALTLAALLTACGGPGESPDSGIRGQAVVAPACPVEPCEALEPPYDGSFSVRRDGEVVKVVRADALGRFAARLDPGDYVLESTGGLPFLKPLAVTVRPHAFTNLALTFDSGIRAP